MSQQDHIEIEEAEVLQVDTTPKNIDEAIVHVYRQVAYVQKKKATAGLNYSFAGERDLIKALRPHMCNAGMYMRVAQYLDVDRCVGQTSGGKPTNITTLRAVVRFTHAESGTFVDVEALGEGSDSSDKSGNKAMTCAFKYAMRQLFCIETGDDPDLDQDKQHTNGRGAQNGAQTPANARNQPATAPTTQSRPVAQPAKPMDRTEREVQVARDYCAARVGMLAGMWNGKQITADAIQNRVPPAVLKDILAAIKEIEAHNTNPSAADYVDQPFPDYSDDIPA